MSTHWDDLWGHDDVVQRFRQTLARDRLASTYLFVGPPGIGKRRFALKLAEALLCTQAQNAELEPCGRCDSCRLLLAGNHPDLECVGLPAGKSRLPISLFIGDDEHRHQEGLCHRIALRPAVSTRKVAIIDDADLFNQESANCLLKTLEEPPPRMLLILIGTSPSKQLPTIRSRSQIVQFRPLAADIVARILLQTEVVADPQQANHLATHSGGSVERAGQLADPSLWQFRERLLDALASPQPDSVRLAKAIQSFVDEAGQQSPARRDQSPARRDRLRGIISFAVDFYRAALRSYVGGCVADDQIVQNAVRKAEATGSGGSAEVCTAALEHCLDALEHVDRNANLPLVIQRWCEALAITPCKTG